MAIKRYIANSDNTITNAYKSDLTTRATGSNMGQSDVLEVFSIFAQATSTSDELSRILINFPISDISSDRSSGILPASGSVNFFIKLYNAEHTETLPRNYTLSVHGASGSWEEGIGLDMDTYTDLTNDHIGSNWISSQGNPAAASLADAIDIDGHANGDKFTMTVPTAAGGDGVTYTFLLDSTTNVNNDSNATTFGISRQIPSGDAATALALIDAINGTANAAVKYGNADTGAGSTLTAGTIGLTAKVGSSNTKITLTMDDNGAAGNVSHVLKAVVGFENDLLLESTFTGGRGPWSSAGGDYYTDTSSSFSQEFGIGNENLEVDITPLVEQWINSAGNILGKKETDGVMVKLSSTYEVSSSTNTGGATKNYYTKKFFGRGTDIFFKKPIIEARWDSSTKDDRGNFFFSSSLAPAGDNLNTIYLYNYVRGKLRNIPSIGTNAIAVSLFSGSSGDSGPDDQALCLSRDDNNVLSNNLFVATGSHVSTGIYKATFAFTGSVGLETIYDVWFKPEDAVEHATGSTNQFHTGTITPYTLQASNFNPNGNYVVSMPYLKDRYSNKRFFKRQYVQS